MIRIFAMSFILFVFGCTSEVSADVYEPRIILSLYDSRVSPMPVYSNGHRLAEMPLNHLGLVLMHHDLNTPLPDPESIVGLRGIIMWNEVYDLVHPNSFLRWGLDVLRHDIPFVILGELAFLEGATDEIPDPTLIAEFLSRWGMGPVSDWQAVTYDVEFPVRDPHYVDYERRIGGILPPYHILRAIDPTAHVALQAQPRSAPESIADLVVLTSKGAYAASGFTHFLSSGEEQIQWILNPFAFFEQIFDARFTPRPDTTTLSGRRIYYSHIDGDGWRNLSETLSRSETPTIAARVILQRALRPYPDLPVTVAPIAGDLDEAWFGNKESRKAARDIFKLPHVELGSHTFSHPFEWGFFEDADYAKEAPFLRFHDKHWGQTQGLPPGVNTQLAASPAVGTSVGINGYDVPRAYAILPFDLEHEIQGSIDAIEQLAPEGKQVRIVQWSGNTMPFPAAIRATTQAGVLNLNGGDARYDREFPSVAWVSPLGRTVGSGYQIYASNSNENTYTNLWTDRFFGFSHLLETVKNTETPVRLKPFNIYYHMYSGAKQAALRALLENLDYARSRPLCPVDASHFASIANGFYSATLRPLDNQRWEISNRGDLQTIRFDHATLKTVDYKQSSGLVGHRHYQGSLYVALDLAVAKPIVALTTNTTPHLASVGDRPYLISGRWRTWDLASTSAGFEFQAQGYGLGVMEWKMLQSGRYETVMKTARGNMEPQTWQTNAHGVLRFELDFNAIQPRTVVVRRLP